MDFRLMAVEALSDENAVLRERVTSMETDVEVYREIVSAALTMTVRLTAQLESARREIRYLKAGRAA